MPDEPNNNSAARDHRDDGIFGIVMETKDQGPILWEAEAAQTSYGAVHNRYDDMKRSPNIIRIAMVRITFERGHEGLLPAMKGLQNV